MPLRRVNQSFVIATSTKVSMEGLELPAIDDAYFAREKAAKKSKEEQFFAQSNEVSSLFTCALLVYVRHPFPAGWFFEAVYAKR